MLEVRLLGPLEVAVDGTPAHVTAPLHQVLLVALALADSHLLTRDQIVDTLWDGDPPPTAANTVQQYVSALRTKIGRNHLVTDAGYRLALCGGTVDTVRFADLISQARGRRRTGDLGGCRRLLQDALAMRRGLPLAGIVHRSSMTLAREALARREFEAQLLLARTSTELGDHAGSLPALEALAEQHPLDETVFVEFIRALVSAGRQADALEVYDSVRLRLAEELGVDPSPALREAQLAVLRQDPTFVGASTPAAVLAVPPVPPSALLGRARELTELEHILSDPSARVVTVAGPGGVGKTRLALEVARRAARDRVVAYVPMAAVADPHLVVGTVANALGLGMLAPDEVAELARAVSGRDMLLVLDNLEQVLAASSDLARLSSLAEGLQILATSREALRISGEHRFLLGPLDTLAVGSMPAAVQLFCERAQAIDSRYRPEDQVDTVAEICRQLDGLPLAIELAAARTNVLAPIDLVRQLDHRLAILDRGPREALDRHGSLRACLAWSVDLLTTEERRVLATASVFVGGMTLPALEAVCAATGGPTHVLASVDSLEGKSLLQVQRLSGRGRLLMLETVREYAGELLEDANSVSAAHALYFHDTLEAQAADILPWPPRTAVEMHDLMSELPNVRAAIDFLYTTGDQVRASDLVVGMWAAWSQRAALSEAEAWATRLLRGDSISMERRLDLMFVLGMAAGMTGRWERSIPLANETLELLAKHPNDVIEALVHSGLAVMIDSPDTQDAVLRETVAARDAAQRSGDRELQALINGTSAVGWASPERMSRQVAEAEEALLVAREYRNAPLEVALLYDIAEAVLTVAEPDALTRGWEYGHAGYRIATELGQVRTAAGCLNNGATAALLAGEDPVEVIADLCTAMRMARSVGDSDLQLELLVRLGGACAAHGDEARASALAAAWRTLLASSGRSPQASNQRIYEAWLAGLDDSERQSPWTLPEAVQMALGESTHASTWRYTSDES